MSCRKCPFAAGLIAYCLLSAATCAAEDEAPKQKYGEWVMQDGQDFHMTTYEAPAESGKGAKTVKHYCIVSPKDPKFAYYVDPLTNKCWCRYDFDNTSFETIKDADQRKLSETKAETFKRIKGAPIVPGSNQIALAVPKMPLGLMVKRPDPPKRP